VPFVNRTVPQPKGTTWNRISTKNVVNKSAIERGEILSPAKMRNLEIPIRLVLMALENMLCVTAPLGFYNNNLM